MNLRELVAVLGHELRTPLAAIVGYQELLIDGIYGDIDERQREPLERILHSSTQLLHLIDGLQELVEGGSGQTDERATASIADLLSQIVGAAKPYAAGRNVKLLLDEQPDHKIPNLPVQRFLRAADLALIAAIKSSPGSTLRVSLAPLDGQLIFEVHDTGLSAQDDPNQAADRTGLLSATRLRLSMAFATAQVGGGTLALVRTGDTTTLTLRIPVETS